MSLLRDVLGSKRHTKKQQPSIISFATAITIGGARIPKRRRPDHSTLGEPIWSSSTPAETSARGTLSLSVPVYTKAHVVLDRPKVTKQPWLAIVLFSNASDATHVPVYHNQARISGQVRMHVSKPRNIRSIDISLIGTASNSYDTFSSNLFTKTARLWERSMGNPQAPCTSQPLRGAFPTGSFVLPFEFSALPDHVSVTHPDKAAQKSKGAVPLPPSFHFKEFGFEAKVEYCVRVHIVNEGFAAVDEFLDFPVKYLPIARPIPRSIPAFPFFSSHDDWPLQREVLSGWSMTPFGGRGRFGNSFVEIEGLLGIPEPAVYAPGQKLSFSVVLHSKNELALTAMTQSNAVEVSWVKTTIFGIDALNPRETTRKNRKMVELANGRIWNADDGHPELESKSCRHGITVIEDDGYSSSNTSESTCVDENDHRAPSPSTFSVSSNVPATVRLNGEIAIPSALSTPSFRYTGMAKEYLLHLKFSHPDYTHISPTGHTCIVTETPVWLVVDPFAQDRDEEGAELPTAKQLRAARALKLSSTSVRALPTDSSTVRRPVVRDS